MKTSGENMDSLTAAQKDMRFAYYGGATGAAASATAWLVAALAATFASQKAGIITLLLAGMLIYPASVVLSKGLGRPGRHVTGNPLAPLAIHGTVWMLLSILIAFVLSLSRPDLFFPAMLLVIGGRYLTFETLYGTKTYVLFGAMLAVAGVMLAVFRVPGSLGAFAGALIEYPLAGILFAQARKERDGAKETALTSAGRG